MIRNLKILGLAIAAVMAMSAVMASAASAVPQFTASAYPATVTGEAAKGSEVFTTEAGKVECASHFVSHAVGAATSTLTVTPKYNNCTAFGLGATVNTEGCSYVFHATEKVESGVYKHHVDVVCPAGQSIKIVAGGGLCRAEVKGVPKVTATEPPVEHATTINQGLTTVKTTNLANGTVTVQPEVAGIDYTVTVDGFGCPFSGTGNKTGATYTGDVVVRRVVEEKNEKGELVVTDVGTVSVSGE